MLLAPVRRPAAWGRHLEDAKAHLAQYRGEGAWRRRLCVSWAVGIREGTGQCGRQCEQNGTHNTVPRNGRDGRRARYIYLLKIARGSVLIFD